MKNAIFNLLKIWGASWAGLGISTLPLLILRFFRVSEWWVYTVTAIVSGLAAAVILYALIYREEYKERVPNTSLRAEALSFGLPALMHVLLCTLTKGNVYVMAAMALLVDAWADMDPEQITYGQVFVVALIFNLFYALAMLLGARNGRKKRARDREQLYESPIH